MYVRHEAPRRRTVVPENYGGVAFSEPRHEEFVPPPTELPCAQCTECTEHEKKPLFPIRSSLFDLGGEDLLLIGLIFLLAQSDMANDIVPLLIILLLC